jgi:hypothetical protein
MINALSHLVAIKVQMCLVEGSPRQSRPIAVPSRRVETDR